ncbi:MAG: SRPBCC family protein [Candidatus Eiseniibacteriota bacterium]
MALSKGAGLTLEIRRTLPHPREKVFEAWTNPRALSRWFAPTDDYRVVVPVLELKPGGRYTIEMHHTGGNVHSATGTYRVIERPGRLEFTWRWDNEPGESETFVTVEFLERGASTELVLTHERFGTEEAREAHNQGWLGCLGRFEKAF